MEFYELARVRCIPHKQTPPEPKNHLIRTPLFFDLEEKKSLLHAATFAMEAGYPFMEALNRATSKLKMFSNQEQEKVLNRHLVGFEVVSRICDPAGLETIL